MYLVFTMILLLWLCQISRVSKQCMSSEAVLCLRSLTFFLCVYLRNLKKNPMEVLGLFYFSMMPPSENLSRPELQFFFLHLSTLLLSTFSPLPCGTYSCVALISIITSLYFSLLILQNSNLIYIVHFICIYHEWNSILTMPSCTEPKCQLPSENCTGSRCCRLLKEWIIGLCQTSRVGWLPYFN